MTQEYFLENGMKVLVNERHRSPVVSVQVWVQTGSADEKKGQEGISHFIEHLVFKGSRSFKVGEIAATIEGHGGELNAYTTFDRTVFHITISRQFLSVALKCLSEMMGFPSFEKDEIDNEREVVIEEIKRSFDSASQQASQNLFKTFYQDHPYGTPVIGFEENIKTVTKDEILDYYKKRYVPANMTLVVVGDFEGSSLKTEVKNFFEPFENLKLDEVQRQAEPELLGPSLDVRQGTHEEAFVHIAWKTPQAKSKDIPALDVLSFILGQGESSRLMKSLRIINPVTNYTVASLFSPRDPGFFAITLSLNKTDFSKNMSVALDLVLEEMRRVLFEEPSVEEMEKAIINTEAQEYYALETVDGLANKFGTYDHLFGDFNYFKKYVQQITQLTGKDIQTVAQKYLTPEAMVISMMSGEEPALGEGLLKKWSNQFSEMQASGPASGSQETSKKLQHKALYWQDRDSEVSMKKIQLEAGATILFRSVRDVPVINVRAAFLGGLRAEAENENGVSELLSRTWVAGTKNLSETALYAEVEKRAGRLRAFGGRNTVGLSMLALENVAEDIFGLFSEVLMQPQISEEIVEREKKYIIEEIRMRKDRPAGQAIRSFMSQLFKDHPYGKDLLGDEATIRSLGLAHVMKFHQRILGAKNLVIAVTGDVDIELWTKRIEKMVGGMSEGQRMDERFDFKPETTSHLYEKSEKQQSHLVMGYPGLKFTDSNRYTLTILQAILAGQGGRLFLELRDKASLAYSVSPLKMEGIDAGYFGAYIGCSPEKVDLALKMLMIEFTKLKQSLVSDEELLRARNYLLGSHDIEMQRSSALGNAMLFDEIYGVPYDDSFHYSEHLNKVTSQMVMDLAQGLFETDPIVSLVGPQDFKKELNL